LLIDQGIFKIMEAIKASGTGSHIPTADGRSVENLTVGNYLRSHWLALTALATVFGVLFYPTIFFLVKYCLGSDDFSHCLLIPVISGLILLANRKKILEYPSGASLIGFLAFVLFLLVFASGYVMAINTLERIGMFGCAIGLVTFLLGHDLIRRQPFPFLFLLLSIPVPYVIYLKISLAFRGFATQLSAGLLHASGVPVINEGNILVVGEHHLGVADACSGIRSLMAIISVSVLFCYLFRTGILGGISLILIAAPVTILVNILRIFLTAWFLYRYEIDLTRGFIHDSMGMILFTVSLIFLYLSWLFVRWLLRIQPPPGKDGPS